MKPLDPDKCPTMVKVLDSICYLYDCQGRPVLVEQVFAHSRVARGPMHYRRNRLVNLGYIEIFKLPRPIKNQAGSAPIVMIPLYRSNGEPYKRDMSLAEPVKTRGTKTICPPGYARSYRVSFVTVRPTAPYKPSTEGMW